MMTRFSLAWGAVLLLLAPAGAETSPLPPADPAPVLRLDAGGPTAFVTALAFSPDGRTLYAAGWDKVVHVWTLNGDGRFVPERRAYRVPVGPGRDGLLNAMALSDDGVWLAVGGTGVFRGQGGFRMPGLVVPSLGGMTDEMLLDQGLIYIFNTQTGAVRVLRGTKGSVAALAFAPTREGTPVRLVSAGRERKDRASDVWAGTARLWDVEAEKALDGKYLPDPGGRRPSLAVWQAADGALQAALGWGDGNLYVWDQANDALRKVRDARNDPVASLPGRDLAVTGLYGVGKARLKLWQVAPGKIPQPAVTEALPKGDPDVLPWALALVSESANGAGDDAAVVTRKQTRAGVDFGLELLSLQEGDRFGSVRAEVPVLWRNSEKLPAVASSLRGDYLALAGNEDHDILVYRVADLLEGKAQPQVLRGTGTLFRSVAFARAGKGEGLLLNALPKRRPGDAPRRPVDADAIFDFARHRLTTDPDGWQIDVPDANGWEAAQPDPQRPALTVTHNGEPVRKVLLPKEARVTDFALLPPGPGHALPILAVASQEHGVPALSLYNAESGEHLREYLGHTGPISCVAFSGDGRLLVSAAEDETICVWSLTNLDKVLGKRGALAGVAVAKGANGELIVGRVEDDSPARRLLRPGEVVEGLVEGDGVRPLETPRAFYEALSRMKPGGKVTLQVRGADGEVRKVMLPVGQAADERKPLLSLFLTRPDKGGQREWVGWNPLGPYEAADANAEAQIGWHFNTGHADTPTRFAPAAEYHDKYYRPGLLRDLIDRADLGDRVAAPRLPAPKLTVGVREGEGAMSAVPFPDAHGHIPVRNKAVTLVVRVGERSLDSLSAVAYQVDDGPEQPFDLKAAAGQMLTAPLTLRRGVHRVSVIARAPEAGPGGYPAETRLVRYQPQAPRLRYEGKLSLTVEKPEFTLRFGVLAGAPGEPALVRNVQTVKGKVVDRGEEVVASDPDKATALARDFRLRPGLNLLEVVAVNRDALEHFEEAETARMAVEVTLIEKAAPPLIALESVAPDGAARERALAVRPGRPVLVLVPSVHIIGKIEAKEVLARADWAQGDKAARPLASFQPGRKELAIDEAVQLKPGPTEFHFHAKTATSDEAEAAVTLEYQPPVPTAHLLPPPDDGKVYGEKESGAIPLEGELTLPDPLHSYKVKVLRDGKELAEAPRVTVDEKGRRLTARVPLHPGTNRLQVEIRNEWGGLFTSAPVQVQYLRPPQVVKLVAPAESKEPVIDLEAQVRSPRPLLPGTIKIEVNGAERRVEATVAEEPPHSGDWTVRARGVALDPGTEKGVATTSRIAFRVSNDEGECREPGKAAVVYRPPVAPPVLTIRQPDDEADVRVQEADLRVVFNVRSEAEITKAQLVRGRDQPVAADLATATRDKEGAYELRAALTVRLQPGLNSVCVEAANKGGGEVSRTLHVNYVYTPARLVLDGLAVSGRAVLEPKALPGGRIEFPPAPAGAVQLRGRVVWDRADGPGLHEARVVRVFVNGFQQQPRPLEAPSAGGRERAFQVDLLLTRPRDNRVSLSVPELDEAAVTRFTVNCTQPEKAQRLHLLMISPTEKDPEVLEKQLFKVFGVYGPENHLQTKVFDPVYPYGPQVGDYAGPEFVNQRLLQIQQSIRQRTVAAGIPSTDLVVVYYRGRELMDARGNLFPTGDEREPAIRPDDLASVFADTPGAYVLLLDVERPAARAGSGPDKVAAWGNHFPAAAQNTTLYSFAWLGAGDVPPQDRLITALQDAMPDSVTLEDVTKKVRTFAEHTPNAEKNLRLDEYIAEEMKVIAVNGR